MGNTIVYLNPTTKIVTKVYRKSNKDNYYNEKNTLLALNSKHITNIIHLGEFNDKEYSIKFEYIKNGNLYDFLFENDE